MKKKKVYKPRTIDMENFNQRRNFAMSLQVTEEVLRDAVNAVGNIYDDVRSYIGSHKNPYFHRKNRFHI